MKRLTLMKSKSIHEKISSIPSYCEIPEGVFRDIHHYRRVLEKITQALSRGHQGKAQNSNGSYLFDGFMIAFRNDIETEEIYLDHLKSKIVLMAPTIKGEGAEARRKRTMFYHGELLKSVEAMKAIGITTIYLVISEQGRKKLDRDSRSRS
jgi:hypothetical protein